MFKVKNADMETKRHFINENKERYSISALCQTLGISRGAYYYEPQVCTFDEKVRYHVENEFKKSKGIYGARKLKVKLKEQKLIVSRQKIRRIMKELGLVSKYTQAIYKVERQACNEAAIENLLNRQFKTKNLLEVVVSDLTRVKVGTKSAYICFIVDLYNREIISFTCSFKKDAKMVAETLEKVPYNLQDIQIFHTDRGTEFANYRISELLQKHQIKRSLSKKGCPFDNGVAEATFKALKKEGVEGEKFRNLKDLHDKIYEFTYWWNYERIHASLDYRTPFEVRNQRLAQANT